MTIGAGYRRGLAAALFVTVAIAAAAPATAQEWPTRNVTFVVPLGAGSGSDLMGRIVGEQLSRQLGQNFVVENRPGAGGTIGANQVAKAAPDGHTLLVYGALGTANALYSKLPYDTLADFTPVVLFGTQPLSIITGISQGYKTLGDLIAAGKSKPNGLNFSSAGVGSASHFAAVRFLVSAGIGNAQHIPYKGADAVTEIVAGRVDFGAQLFSTTLPLLKEGKLRSLAVSSAKRSSFVPDVPTTVEAGLKADSIYPFYSGIFAPSKTPRAIIEKLHNEAIKAMQSQLVQDRFKTLGVEPMPMDLAQIDKFFREDVAAAQALVKAAGITPQ
jgi:tripartite-type tricarboxylate transporter receptor subunit TctC